jgi:hypothetical protein
MGLRELKVKELTQDLKAGYSFATIDEYSLNLLFDLLRLDGSL